MIGYHMIYRPIVSDIVKLITMNFISSLSTVLSNRASLLIIRVNCFLLSSSSSSLQFPILPQLGAMTTSHTLLCLKACLHQCRILLLMNNQIDIFSANVVFDTRRVYLLHTSLVNAHNYCAHHMPYVIFFFLNLSLLFINKLTSFPLTSFCLLQYCKLK